MTKSIMSAVAFLVLSTAGVKAAAQAPVSGIPAPARRAIDEANAEWLNAMKRADARAVAAPFQDDAVFVTSTGESVRGRAAIEQMMRNRFVSGGHAVDGTIKQDGVMAVGSLIYEWGHVALHLVRGHSEPTEFKGRYLAVWAADSSGHWQITRNLSLPF